MGRHTKCCPISVTDHVFYIRIDVHNRECARCAVQSRLQWLNVIAVHAGIAKRADESTRFQPTQTYIIKHGYSPSIGNTRDNAARQVDSRLPGFQTLSNVHLSIAWFVGWPIKLEPPPWSEFHKLTIHNASNDRHAALG